MTVVWNGKAIIAEVEARTRKAIDEITEETAKGIVAGRWWESHSAAGLVSRVVTEPAKHDGVGSSGRSAPLTATGSMACSWSVSSRSCVRWRMRRSRTWLSASEGSDGRQPA
jgi:hypothetical protein